MQYKIDRANQIFSITDRYPIQNKVVLKSAELKEKKIVISLYRWSLQMLRELYDNRDNLEMSQFPVCHESRE
jgi:hypothetical protein